MTINSTGQRDREHAVAKPANTYRIALLGDSFTVAMQVPLEKTFGWRMGEHLSRCPALQGRAVEPLNFGVSSFGTAQELLTLSHRVWNYQPDLVILAFYPGNDIRNNSRQLEPDQRRPFYTLHDHALLLDDRFLEEPGFRDEDPVGELRDAIRRRSHLLALLERAGMRLRGQSATPGEGALDQGSLAVLDEPATPAWREAWEITERLLTEISRQTRAHGADYFLAILPLEVQVHPDPEVPRRILAQVGTRDLDYPIRRLQQLGNDQGFAVLPLAPGFKRHVDQFHDYLHGFGQLLGYGHFNEQGHALAAELLADFQCRRLLRQSGAQNHSCVNQLDDQPSCAGIRTGAFSFGSGTSDTDELGEAVSGRRPRFPLIPKLPCPTLP